MRLLSLLAFGVVIVGYSPRTFIGSMSAQAAITATESTSQCDSTPVQLKAKSQMSDYGVLRSADNGKTWTKVVNDSGGIDSLVEDRSGQVFAATLGALSGPDLHLGYTDNLVMMAGLGRGQRHARAELTCRICAR